MSNVGNEDITPAPGWRRLLAGLALLGVEVGGRLVMRRLAAPEQEDERERFMNELRAIKERHPHDPTAREAEWRALHERHPSPNMLRKFGPALPVALINSRLRRRLAATTEILVRRRSRSHSP
jgi:hypothetical protein